MDEAIEVHKEVKRWKEEHLRMASFNEEEEEAAVVVVVVFLARPRISSKDTMARLANDPREHRVSSDPNWPDLIA